MSSLFSLIIFLITLYTSYKGFKDYQLFHKYTFNVYEILRNKDFKRLFTSGFLHVDWMHLILNMYIFLSFSSMIESILGYAKFVLLYILSLLAGNFLSLYIHRNDDHYIAAGASGAVCGVIFSTVAMFPQFPVTLLFIHWSAPSWVLGTLYFTYCIYGIKSLNDNIGHDAHLGGAFIGLLLTPLISPYPELNNYWLIGLMALLPLVFLGLIFVRPEWLYIKGFSFKRVEVYRNIDDLHQDKKYSEQQQLDQILDKISKKGLDSLTKKERKLLERISKNKPS